MKCPRCQHENPPRAKFCLEGGEPVASQATAEPRFTSPETCTPKRLAEKIHVGRDLHLVTEGFGTPTGATRGCYSTTCPRRRGETRHAPSRRRD
jgi:hypothetical protein